MSGRLPGYISTITVADGTGLRRLAGEFRAFKTEMDFLGEGTGSDLTEFIISRLTTCLTTGTLAFHHPGTFLAGNSAHTDLQSKTPFD